MVPAPRRPERGGSTLRSAVERGIDVLARHHRLVNWLALVGVFLGVPALLLLVCCGGWRL